jgi:ribosomal-protein-serine acetyltransferase
MLDPIRSSRLLLRSWQLDDASQLKDAIDSSLPELQAWVPWAMHEPSSLDTIATRLAVMRQKFVSGEDWAFAVFDADETRLLGGAGLHPRGTTDHLEIGYWIRTDATGQGFALEAAQALCVAAFTSTSVDRLEIHCDAGNARSASVARRLGFQLTNTLRQDIVTARGETRDTLVWTMLRSHEVSWTPG